MNITLSHINCFYGKHQVLFDINLDYKSCESVVLLGPSGAGKSTLLRIFNLLQQPSAGKLEIAGEHFDFQHPPSEKQVRLLRQKVGMVFQQYNLWPHLTVLDNLIEAPRTLLGYSKADATEKADTILKQLRLDAFTKRYPSHLSGGQQQRVAIARALMMEPEVLLFDEPTAALDPEITAQVANIINDLSKSGISQIIVTHEVDFAKKVASQVVYMEQGKVIEKGRVDILKSPHTAEFSAFLSH